MTYQNKLSANSEHALLASGAKSLVVNAMDYKKLSPSLTVITYSWLYLTDLCAVTLFSTVTSLLLHFNNCNCTATE